MGDDAKFNARGMNLMVQLIVYLNSFLTRNRVSRADIDFMRDCIRSLFWNLNNQSNTNKMERMRNVSLLEDILKRFIVTESQKLSKSRKIKELEASKLLHSSSELEEFAESGSVSKEKFTLIREFLIRSIAK